MLESVKFNQYARNDIFIYPFFPELIVRNLFTRKSTSIKIKTVENWRELLLIK